MHDHDQAYPGDWPPDWPDITDQAVVDAIAAVPRHMFVPRGHRDSAYDDCPLPIGEGQTISQPYIVALMTQAMRLTGDSRVLEIGTGSGYQAAVLCEITPHVYSIETRPALAEAACRRLSELSYPAEVRVGDGWLGWPEHAPYDGIIVTAAAPEVPPALVQQLGPAGRLVIPIGRNSWEQRLWLIRKAGGRLHCETLAEVRFVPLVGGPCGPEDDEELERIRRQMRKALGTGN